MLHICVMRVLFDHQVFSWQTYGGISRYIFELARGLDSLGHESVFPQDFYSGNRYLQDLPGVHAKPLTNFQFKGKKWLQERLSRAASLRALRNTAPDVFHPTYFGDYFLRALPCNRKPFVVTIHDMIHEKFGHGRHGLFSLDAKVVENKRLLAQKADAVIVVSEHTRRDVLQFIPEADPAKIHTIYHGNSLAAPGLHHVHSLSLPGRYVLFVGQRKGYKNFSWMLEQLAALLRADNSLYLVAAGGPAFDAVETALLSSLGLSTRVIHQKNPSDADLAELYSRAQCFVFPSAYEGFGIPVLEAFACGCPAVLNAVSSLPEVGGDAVRYFPDQDGAALQQSVQALLHEPALRQRLIEKGYERLRQFSWENSVQAHLKIYQSLL